MTAPANSACRVTVVTPQARVDVALPMQSTLAELIPQLIRLSGAEGQASADNPGWGLSKLGGAPMPLGMTVAGAAVRDGDVLYLNPRERRLTPLLFDDVVDAIASNAGQRDGAWRPEIAYRVAVAAAAVVFVAVTVLLLRGLSGIAPFAAPAGCGVVALALLVGGGALARAYGDSTAGAVCALAGVPAAALAGLSVFGLSLGAAQLALGCTAVTVYGVLAIVAITDRLAWFLSVTVAALLGAIAAAVPVLLAVPAAASAAVAVALTTGLCSVAPMLSLRLANLPLPRVPSDMDAFRTAEKPTMGAAVLTQTELAARLLAALLGAFGLVAVLASVVLLRGASVFAAALVGVFGVVWMLRSRSYSGTAQRVVLVGTGLAALVCLGVWLLTAGDRTGLLAAAGVLALAGVLTVNYAGRAVRGRKSPYWSRLLDIAEFLGLIAIIPLAGQVVGIYAALRGAL